MSAIIAATAVTTIGGALLSGGAQKSAARDATAAQERSGELAIAEQKRQFDSLQKLLSPYVQAGEGAIAGQQNLIGLGGADEQQQAIDALQQGPEFQSLVQQGEEGILQNAAATGGLRGGNVQGSLAQFRPQILSQLINQQYGRLGGLANIGQASAAGVGAAGQRSGEVVGGIYGGIGDAQAQGALARGKANADVFGALSRGAGTVIGSF